MTRAATGVFGAMLVAGIAFAVALVVMSQNQRTLSFGEAGLLIGVVRVFIFCALACGFAAVGLGLRRKEGTRSLAGILAGIDAALIGAVIAFRFDWPPSAFEKGDAYLAAASAIIGIFGAVLCSRRK